MKPIEVKHEFIELRAKGLSYDKIAKKLKISKSTCIAWNEELKEEISKIKNMELEALYQTYGMKKEARIKSLGETLNKVNEALKEADFKEVPAEKLLNFKLKYSEALLKEYVAIDEADTDKDISAIDILNSLADLLNKLNNREITIEQADKESAVLNSILKAYTTIEATEPLEVEDLEELDNYIYGDTEWI